MNSLAKLTFLALLGLLTAQLLTTGARLVLRPSMPPLSASPGATSKSASPHREDVFEVFLKRNLFDAHRSPSTPPPSPPKPTFADCTEAQGATLVATVVSDAKDALAFIHRSSEKPHPYSVGDRLEDGRKVADITRRRVMLRGEGRCETLSLRRSNSPRARTAKVRPKPSQWGIRKRGNTFEVPKAAIESLTQDSGPAMRDGRVVMSRRGELKGLKFLRLKKGGLYDQLGLRRGDLLTRINGHELDNMGNMMELYMKLQNAESVSIDMIRGGVKRTLNYEIR